LNLNEMLSPGFIEISRMNTPSQGAGCITVSCRVNCKDAEFVAEGFQATH